MKTLNDFYRLFPSHPVLAEQPVATTPLPILAAAPVLTEVHVNEARESARYRQRGLGTGYGRSSGYAKDSYTANRDTRLLRVC